MDDTALSGFSFCFHCNYVFFPMHQCLCISFVWLFLHFEVVVKLNNGNVFINAGSLCTRTTIRNGNVFIWFNTGNSKLKCLFASIKWSQLHYFFHLDREISLHIFLNLFQINIFFLISIFQIERFDFWFYFWI